MGCGSSRFEQRNENLDDLNTVSLNFVDCSDKTYYDNCPVDKFVLQLGQNKELKELYDIIDLRAQKQQGMIINFEEIISCVKSQQDLLERDSLTTQTRIKEPLEGQKYKMSEATGQIQNVISMLERHLTKIQDTIVLDETQTLLIEKAKADAIFQEKVKADHEAKNDELNQTFDQANKEAEQPVEEKKEEDQKSNDDKEIQEPEQADEEKKEDEVEPPIDKAEEQNENNEEEQSQQVESKPDQVEEKDDDKIEEQKEDQVPESQDQHLPENAESAQGEQAYVTPQEEFAGRETVDAKVLSVISTNNDDSVQHEGGSLLGTLSVSGSPYQYAQDDYNYANWEDIPAVVLKALTMNPYYADLVRSQIMKWEFNYNKTRPEQQQWLKTAGIIGQAVTSAQKQNGELWFSGLVGDEDFQNLKDMAKNQSDILFPGVIIGWKTQAEAEIACYMLNKAGNKIYHRVMFFVQGCDSLKFLNCRYYSYRLKGKVTKMVSQENQEHHYFHIEGSTPTGDNVTIAEWEESQNK